MEVFRGSARNSGQGEGVYRQAVAAYQDGDLGAAASHLGSALQQQPQLAEAWDLLGCVVRRMGRFEEAMQLATEAVGLNTNQGVFAANLALILLEQGKQAEAVEWARKASNSSSKDASEITGRGCEHLEQGDARLAEECFRLALEVDPNSAEYWNFLGISLRQLGQVDSAIRAYEQAVRLDPSRADIMVNLGNAHRDLSQLSEAVDCYDEAIRLQTNLAVAWNNRGLALERLGQRSTAEESYRRAVQLDPRSVDARNNLAMLLATHRQFQEAVELLQSAINDTPDRPELHSNLGKVYSDMQRLDDSRVCFRQMATLCPHSPLVELKQYTVYPRVFATAAEIEVLSSDLQSTAMRLAEQEIHLPFAELFQWANEPPFALQFQNGNLRPIKEAYASAFTSCVPQLPLTRSSGKPRIGMVVTRNHEGIFLRSLSGVLRRLQADDMQFFIACAPSAVDRVRRELSGSTADIQVAALPDAPDAAVKLLWEAACHVLYYWEIGSDTQNYFLPFCRLAPVQCTSWGIQVTSGIPNVDYYLSSQWAESSDAGQHYSERLILSDTMLTYQPLNDVPQMRPAADFGLPDDLNLYGCLQNPGKFHPDFDVLIRDILTRDPRGVIVVNQDPHNVVMPRLVQRWQQSLGDCAARVRVLPRLSTIEYQQVLQLCDVLLDPPYFGGVNTTYDALAVNRPLVTCPTPFQRGRYTWGCLQRMGLGDLTADTPQDFVEKAVCWAGDREQRQEICRRIAEARGAIFEDQRAVHEHERIFRQLLDSIDRHSWQ